VHLAVVIPMFNEELGARRCLDRVSEIVESLHDPVTVIVVDDGSADATLEIVKRAIGDGLRLELVEGGVNRGYGEALRQGAVRAEALGADWVLFIDSDLTNPPEQIVEFQQAAGPAFDVIKACRYCPGGSTGDVPFKRVVISRYGNLLARALTGIPHADLTNGFRAFRTSSYLDLPLTERGFAVIVEEMYFARLRGLRVGSIPSTLSVRASDLRPTAFRYTARQLWAYLRWPIRTALARPRRYFAA
jgi:dolichol-phosphate mannosyltransferase